MERSATGTVFEENKSRVKNSKVVKTVALKIASSALKMLETNKPKDLYL